MFAAQRRMAKAPARNREVQHTRLRPSSARPAPTCVTIDGSIRSLGPLMWRLQAVIDALAIRHTFANDEDFRNQPLFEKLLFCCQLFCWKHASLCRESDFCNSGPKFTNFDEFVFGISAMCAEIIQISRILLKFPVISHRIF